MKSNTVLQCSLVHSAICLSVSFCSFVLSIFDALLKVEMNDKTFSLGQTFYTPETFTHSFFHLVALMTSILRCLQSFLLFFVHGQIILFRISMPPFFQIMKHMHGKLPNTISMQWPL